MAVGPSRNGQTALMVLSTIERVDDDVIAALKSNDGILDLHRIEL